MPIRYMGTKRSISVYVQAELASLAPRGPVLDLFSGIGCVAECLVNIAPVHTNDVLSFTAALARARFKGERNKSVQELLSAIREPYRNNSEQESRKLRSVLRAEQRAMDLGKSELAKYDGRSRACRKFISDASFCEGCRRCHRYVTLQDG